MIPAATVIHAEPPFSCAGCRYLSEVRRSAAGWSSVGYVSELCTSFCRLHVTPFARCGLYEKPPAGKPSYLSSLMTR